MENIKVKSETINGLVQEFRFEFMDFVYAGNERDVDEKDDMTYIYELNDILNDILREVAVIESERDRAKEQASRFSCQLR